MTSRQPSSPDCIGAIPALATTMSSRPSSSTPACPPGPEPGAGGLDEFDGGCEVLRACQRILDAADRRADVDSDDVRAVGRQSHRGGAALSAGAAGGACDFPPYC